MTTSTARSMAGKTLYVLIPLALSRLLGFVRELVFAGYFGASPEVDAYVAARTFPELLMNLVFAGVLGYAIIPVFLRIRSQDSLAEGWRVVSAILTLLLVIVALVVGVGLLFSQNVIGLFAPGLSGDTVQLAIRLNWILLPTVIFSVITGVSGALLNALDEFLRPALNSLIVNVVIIACVLLFASRWGVTAAAVGMLIGVVLQVVQLLPALWSKGAIYIPGFYWRSPWVRRVVAMTIPILLLQVLIYGRVMIGRLVASNLPPGSLAILNYGDRLATLPVLIFANSVNRVAFTALADAAAAIDLPRLKRSLDANFRMIAITIVPSSLLLTFFALPAVRLVYERGAFDAQTSLTTASLLTWSAVGLFFFALMITLSQVFFALQDVKTPLLTVLAGTAVNAFGSHMLAARFGIIGLGMGSTLGVGFSAILLGIALHHRLTGFGDRALILYFGKIFVASIGANLLVLSLSSQLKFHISPNWENSPLYTLFLFALVLGLYGLTLGLMRVKEVALLTQPLRRLLRMS